MLETLKRGVLLWPWWGCWLGGYKSLLVELLGRGVSVFDEEVLCG
jgi:hypothetical protein